MGARSYPGGEGDTYSSLEFDVVKLYPLIDFSDPNHAENSTFIRWHIPRLIVLIVVLTICFCIVGTLRQKEKRKSKTVN